MPQDANEAKFYEDETEPFGDEDNRMPWEIRAQEAVDEALENAEFDDVRGVIEIQGREYQTVEDLCYDLEQIYDTEWYAYVPFDSGEAVFRGDSSGYVGDQISHLDIENFYNEIRDPEEADEIFASRELVEDIEKSRLIRVDLQEINEELIRHLARHPHYMRNLDPRKFEELIAELLRDKGYEVELTPRSRDGGLDIIAVKRGDLGSALTLVECKRFSESKKVGVTIIRGLYGVVEEKRATQGLIATTSFFTKDAVAFRDKLQYRLSLADFDKLTEFLRQWRTHQR